MKKITLLAVAILASSVLRAATEESTNRTFTIQSGGQVTVDVDFGSVEITTNSTPEVAIEVHRKVGFGSEEKEQAFLAGNPVTITQDGNKITVKQRGRSKNGIWNWLGSQRMEAKYILQVPAQFSAKVSTSGGSIQIKDLQGEVQANTSGGGLKFARIHGTLHGDTSGGTIGVVDCQGETTVSTSGGGISVTGGGGSLNTDTSGGSIAIRNYDGPAHANTSGGGIVLENISGDVKASTSGGSISASLRSGVTNEVDLGTSGGSLVVKLPEKNGYELDASTTGGGVSCDVPIEVAGKKKHGELRGTINGGGKMLKLRTSGGSIHVRKQTSTAS